MDAAARAAAEDIRAGRRGQRIPAPPMPRGEIRVSNSLAYKKDETVSANKRTKNNVVVDSLGYLSFLALVSTGIIMKFVLLPGRDRAAGDPTSVLGLGRHEWGDVHFWASMIFTAAIVVHLLLHWSWIVGVIRKMAGAAAGRYALPALGLPILIAAVPLMGFRGFGGEEEHGTVQRPGVYASQEGRGWAASAVNLSDSRGPAVAGEGSERVEINGFFIRGRDTLADIERMTGVTPAEIATAMNISAPLPANERISSLKDSHNFEMDDLRRKVAGLAAAKRRIPDEN